VTESPSTRYTTTAEEAYLAYVTGAGTLDLVLPIRTMTP